MKRIWFLAVFNGIVLVMLSIIGNRVPYDFGGTGSLMKKLDALRSILFTDNEEHEEIGRFFLVNIGNDRELVPSYDEFYMPTGTRAVVSRKKLASFLDSVKNANYKAIILDVLFFKNDVSDSDSTLFSLISTMPRLVTVLNRDEDAIPAINNNRLARSEYSISINENNFVKYRYDSDDTPSIALMAFNAAENIDLRIRGVFPVASNHLLMQSQFLYLPYNIKSYYDNNQEKIIYNVGVDLLNVYNAKEIESLVEDRIIVIGDFSGGDEHDTYIGSMSGPMIIINAVDALYEGRHEVAWWSIVVLLVIYILIVYAMLILKIRPATSFLKQNLLLNFLASFVSYTSIVIFTYVVIYLITGVMYDYWLPEAYLTVLYFIIQHDILQKIRLTHKNSKKQ